MSATRSVDRALEPVRDLARARADARIGMVFQHFNLFAHLTALENVIEAPIRVYGDAREGRARRGARACWRASGSRDKPTPIRTGSRAGSSSASRSPARSR